MKISIEHELNLSVRDVAQIFADMIASEQAEFMMLVTRISREWGTLNAEKQACTVARHLKTREAAKFFCDVVRELEK